jgi:hypothetical protein
VLGTDTLGNSALVGGDFFLVKYDESGNVLWTRSAQGDHDDESFGICSDANGNCYITGGYYSTTLTFDTITLTNSSFGHHNFFLVKYDSSGNVLWARNAGGNSDDRGNGISMDAAGNLFITGCFYSNQITFGNTSTLFKVGKYDIFIVKYDQSGNAIWAKSAGANNDEIAFAISTEANGNSYITGFFYSPSLTFGSSVLTNANGGTGDVFIAKYDSSGNALWAKSAGGNTEDYGFSIGSDANGNAYVSGNFSSPSITFGATTLTNGGTENFFIAKYDSSGNVDWANGGGATLINWILSAVTDATGNSFVTGVFSGPSITIGTTTLTNVNPVNGNYDIFLAKYDSWGNVSWAKSAGGTSTDWGKGICLDATGNTYLTGYFFSDSVVFGNDALKNFNTSLYADFYVAKLGNTTSMWEANSFSGTLNIFPNPGNGHIKISSSEIIDEIEIRNISGQVVLKSQPNEKYASFQLFNSGIYFVTTRSAGKTTRMKLVEIGN